MPNTKGNGLYIWRCAGPSRRKHGQQSDYLQIEKVLKQHGFRVQVKATRNYRPIKESQSSLRAKVLNASGERSFFVNPVKCPYGDKGLKLTQLKKRINISGRGW